jgi:hypothetical protein
MGAFISTMDRAGACLSHQDMVFLGESKLPLANQTQHYLNIINLSASSTQHIQMCC